VYGRSAAVTAETESLNGAGPAVVVVVAGTDVVLVVAGAEVEVVDGGRVASVGSGRETAGGAEVGDDAARGWVAPPPHPARTRGANNGAATHL
jgi:hypothetical protein